MPIQSLPHHKSAARRSDRADCSDSLRITCVIHSLNGGGAERVMAGLVNRLAARGHSVCLVTLDDGMSDRHAVDPAVERICLDAMRHSHGLLDAVGNNLRRILRLRGALRHSRPEVVLSFCDATNVLTLLAARPLGVPVVVSERSDPAQQTMGRVWSLLRRRSYRRAARLVALTRSSAQSMAAWSPRPVEVIASAVEPPPAVDALPAVKPPPALDASTADAALPRARRTVLGVGRLAVEKGFDRLLVAFTEVADEFPHWDLKIAGEGPERPRLEALIAASGIADRIHLLGWQRPIAPLYQQADLFVLPSRYDGFPSALLEAMAAGMAAIAVDCESGPREIIRDGVDGVLIAPEQLAATMRRLMRDEERRTALGRRAVDVVQRFGWDEMVDRYLDVLRQAAR